MVRRLGFGVVRLTDRDLRDPEVRAQAERLTSEERLLLVRLAGQPSDDLLQLLQRLRRVIMAVEVLLPEDEIAGWRAAPPPLGVPVRLAPLGQGARTPVASAEVPEGAGAGFRVLELERLTGLDLQADGVFAGIVARLDRDQPVFRTLLRAVAAVSARELELSFDLDRSLAVEDERRLEGRAAEAAFAANALPDAEIVLGGLLELDGDAGSTAAGRAISTVGTLPLLRPGGFAWSIAQRGDPTIHGYESEIGIELLSMPEVRDGEYALPVSRLDLPVDPRTFGEAAVLGLDGQRLLVARLTGDDDGRSIRLDPPAPGDRPIILRLS